VRRRRYPHSYGVEFDSEPLRFDDAQRGRRPEHRGGGRIRRAAHTGRGELGRGAGLSRRDVEGYAADYREGGPVRRSGGGRYDEAYRSRDRYGPEYARDAGRRGGRYDRAYRGRGGYEQPAESLRGFPGGHYDRWPGSRAYDVDYRRQRSGQRGRPHRW
jgi:hypothetical protein